MEGGGELRFDNGPFHLDLREGMSALEWVVEGFDVPSQFERESGTFSRYLKFTVFRLRFNGCRICSLSELTTNMHSSRTFHK